MDESKLSTIEQIEAFLGASEQVAFTAHEGDTERYAHISRVLRPLRLSPAQHTRARRAAGLPAPHQRPQPLPAHPAGVAMGGLGPSAAAQGQGARGGAQSAGSAESLFRPILAPSYGV